MNGLQTLQKLNDARVALAHQRSKTPVADIVEGYFVFEPNGYEIAYHPEDKLPQDEAPFVSIAFKGEDSSGARFDISRAGQLTACNRSLEGTAQLAASYGLDGVEVESRLRNLFLAVNSN